MGSTTITITTTTTLPGNFGPRPSSVRGCCGTNSLWELECTHRWRVCTILHPSPYLVMWPSTKTQRRIPSNSMSSGSLGWADNASDPARHSRTPSTTITIIPEGGIILVCLEVPQQWWWSHPTRCMWKVREKIRPYSYRTGVERGMQESFSRVFSRVSHVPYRCCCVCFSCVLYQRFCWLIELGDNPSNSLDSRQLGPIPKGLLVGIAEAVVWPPSRWCRLPRWTSSSSSSSLDDEAVGRRPRAYWP